MATLRKRIEALRIPNVGAGRIPTGDAGAYLRWGETGPWRATTGTNTLACSTSFPYGFSTTFSDGAYRTTFTTSGLDIVSPNLHISVASGITIEYGGRTLTMAGTPAGPTTINNVFMHVTTVDGTQFRMADTKVVGIQL